MSATQDHNRPHPKRKLLLLDRRFQIGLASKTVLMMVGFGMAYGLGGVLLSTEWFAKLVGPARVGMATGIAELAFFAAATLIVHIAVVRVSHTVAGPAFMIERGLSQLAQGQVDATRFTPRDGDHLVAVAQAGSALRDRMLDERFAVREVIEILQESGGAGTAGQAIERLADAFGLEVEIEDDVVVDVDSSRLAA